MGHCGCLPCLPCLSDCPACLMPSLFSAAPLALVVLVLSAQAQTIPVPKRYDGFVRGSGQIVIEAYYDLMCPDSRQSWPTMKALVDQAFPGKVALVVHTFPLPYHRWSFTAAQGGHFANSVGHFFDWMEAVYSNQEAWGNDPTANMTSADIVGQMAQVAASGGWTSTHAMAAGLEARVYDLDTRASWKYGCSRAVTGTPTFFVNGVVLLSALPSRTVDDWKKVIEPLL